MAKNLPLSTFLSLGCCALLTLTASSGALPDDVNEGLKTIRSADAMKHIAYLASDALEGREAGSDGGNLAAVYIAERFREYGLEPRGDEGTYFQPFQFSGEEINLSFGEIERTNYLKIVTGAKDEAPKTFALGSGFLPLTGSSEGVVSGEILFAGYGITATEYGYDDYKGMSTKGKIVVVFDHEPQENDPASKFNGDKLTKYGEWTTKVATAVSRGAAALIIVVDPVNHKDRAIASDHTWPAAQGDPVMFPIPVAFVGKEAAEALVRQGKKSLEDLQKAIDAKLQSASFTGKETAELIIGRHGPVQKGMKNVVAVWQGADDRLKDEYIVIGAHYDHVGRGEFGSRRGQGKIHNGADDNASGTSALLEIAEALSKVKLKRSVVLIAFDAEEKGLVGSREFTAHPTIPLGKTIAMLNMDMIGRNDKTVLNVGLTDKKNELLGDVLVKIEQKFSVRLDRNGADQYIARSDQWNFHVKGVPGAFFFGGVHEDYHTDDDDVEKINKEKVELFTKIVFFALHRLANK